MTKAAPRVLLIGSKGQVGRAIVQATGQGIVAAELIETSRSSPIGALRVHLERRETIDRAIDACQPDHVILAAAATNVRWCERNPDESHLINVLGPSAVAHAVSRAGASLTFMSTDYVFDGANGPYSEADPTRPVNFYGRHKLAAEEATLAANQANLVVRTCQVFGNDPRRMNFVTRVVDQLRAGRDVPAATDLYGTPTYAPDLARQLLRLSLEGANGIWHVAGSTFLSRYELALRCAAAFDCQEGLILEVTADVMDDQVQRPRLAGLQNGRLAAAGLLQGITDLESALAALASADRQVQSGGQ